MTASGRPTLVVAVLGTATEVGKTWVTAAVATELRRGGRVVAARKPIQSYDPETSGTGEASEPTDAEVLAAATGEDPEAVCPQSRWLPVPMAPPMAAAVLGEACPTTAELLDELTWRSDAASAEPSVDVGFVETVGGSRSPMTAGDDSVGFATAVAPDRWLLVADANLGVLHDVRAARAGIDGPVVVHLNRFDAADDLHRRNRDWLRDVDAEAVTTGVAELAAALVERP